MNDAASYVAAAAGSARLPWIPLAPGVSSKPLAFLRNDGGWVGLLRLEPGARIPLHRHQGEVHGFVLTGRRRLGPRGLVLGPGEYEYEPAGNADTWAVEGEQPLVGLFIVRGAVEYLDAAGRVVRRETTESKAESYRRFCAEHGIAPLDLYR